MAAVKGSSNDIVLKGYLKKLKTMKKKYFVLRGDSADASARIEYYDTEKKFKSRSHPKRSIPLRSCFNINRRLDTKHKYVIALYTKDDCFCVVLDTEHDLVEWLRALLSLQRGNEDAEGEPPRPTFEHVWQVNVQKRGLGISRGILGPYHLCLTDKTLSLVRIGSGAPHPPTTTAPGSVGANPTGPNTLNSLLGISGGDKHMEQHVEFPLTCIRVCGDSVAFFYIEVGRQAVTGAGELWMHTEDPNIAQNMHQTILHAMTNKGSKEELTPKSRTRSSSANEASKPISVLQRYQSHNGGPKQMNFSPSSDSAATIVEAPPNTSACPNTTEPYYDRRFDTNSVQNVPFAVSTVSCNPQYPPMIPTSVYKIPNASSCTASTTSAAAATSSSTSTSTNSTMSLLQQLQLSGKAGATAPLLATLLPQRSSANHRRHSVSATPVVSHQRAFSLPITNNMVNQLSYQSDTHILHNSSNITGPKTSTTGTNPTTVLLIHHQRTRSLPLCQETAIPINNNHIQYENNNDICKNLVNTNAYIGNNSMESIVEDPYVQCNNVLPASKKLSPKNGDSPIPRRGSTGCRGGKSRQNNRNAAASRERCDSLPSRARTTSEGHPMIPHQHQHHVHQHHQHVIQPQRTIPNHRPHSMYTRGLSYSPPVTCSPLSPPSGACSTDSAGSSLSIDEPDCYQHSLTPDEPGLVSRYISSLTPDTQVILEETCDECWSNDNDKTLYDNKMFPDTRSYNNRNYDDFGSRTHTSLSLPISGGQGGVRKSSPAAVGSVEGRGSYMDMYSPCGSSPGDHTGGPYLPMSPGIDLTRTIYSGGSVGNSRGSSVMDEAQNGYVPMAPASTDDGYVDMEPHQATGMSPAASSCSITSGTPSTDLRFSEFHLEKVSSYFTPSEDETSSVDRPIRAYSVGSRPELIKRKNRLDAINAQESARVRAFSVGSRSKMRNGSELYNRVLNHGTPPHVINNTQNSGKKSSSAPILSNFWNERRPLHGSIEPMDDLMEIDFTQNVSEERKHKEEHKERATAPVPIAQQADEGYMDMSPKTISRNSYVEMKPMGKVSSEMLKNEYMDMTPGKQTGTKASSTSPLKPNCVNSPKSSSLSTSPKSDHDGPYVKMSGSLDKIESGPYLDMSGSYDKTFNTLNSKLIASLEKHTSCIVDTSKSPKLPIIKNVPKNADYMNMSPGRSKPVDLPQRKHPNAPDGYVEMSWNGQKVNSKTNTDEYMNMSFNKNSSKNHSSADNDSRYFSQPITIQSGTPTNRKIENSTKPGYLSLSGNSHRTPRNNKKSSKEGVVTPSGSQATIFPFSPGSPEKPFTPKSNHLIDNFNSRKCAVDATSGTVKLTNIPLETPQDPTKILNTDYEDDKIQNLASSSSESSNANSDITDSDYVNYNPAQAKPCVNRRSVDTDDEYAVMNPTARKISASCFLGKQTPENTSRKAVLVTITNQTQPASASFKPIPVENEIKKAGSPRPLSSFLNRQLSERKPEAGYEILARNSDSLTVRSTENVSALTRTLIPRPNSVNSEKVTCKALNTRPSSANSDRLPTLTSKSRPQSVSSELPSRPTSVLSENNNSRPASVTCERECLHYASLDLPPCSNENESEKSPKPVATQHSLTESSSGAPSPNVAAQEPTFTYAQIDFVKSENLKPPTAKVKH